MKPKAAVQPQSRDRHGAMKPRAGDVLAGPEEAYVFRRRELAAVANLSVHRGAISQHRRVPRRFLGPAFNRRDATYAEVLAPHSFSASIASLRFSGVGDWGAALPRWAFAVKAGSRLCGRFAPPHLCHSVRPRN